LFTPATGFEDLGQHQPCKHPQILGILSCSFDFKTVILSQLIIADNLLDEHFIWSKIGIVRSDPNASLFQRRLYFGKSVLKKLSTKEALINTPPGQICRTLGY
jgi:hypothetical protein